MFNTSKAKKIVEEIQDNFCVLWSYILYVLVFYILNKNVVCFLKCRENYQWIKIYNCIRVFYTLILINDFLLWWLQRFFFFDKLKRWLWKIDKKNQLLHKILKDLTEIFEKRNYSKTHNLSRDILLFVREICFEKWFYFLLVLKCFFWKNEVLTAIYKQYKLEATI